MNKTHRKNTRK